MEFKTKKDKYLRKRGGESKIIEVRCMKCNNQIFIYQKDMPRGWLKRCYLNRIVSPEEWSNLQDNPLIKEPKDLKNLICKCGSIIGSPMKHKDGRLAYKMIKGMFMRKNYE